jgi:lycopene cyclase domain-containing protein
MTYWLINLPFLVVATVVLGVAAGSRVPPRALPWLISAVVMMTLTAVFDNAIIGSGLVAYDTELISGVMIGVAPIEDFAYTLAALLIIPALWHLLEPRGVKRS